MGRDDLTTKHIPLSLPIPSSRSPSCCQAIYSVRSSLMHFCPNYSLWIRAGYRIDGWLFSKYDYACRQGDRQPCFLFPVCQQHFKIRKLMTKITHFFLFFFSRPVKVERAYDFLDCQKHLRKKLTKNVFIFHKFDEKKKKNLKNKTWYIPHKKYTGRGEGVWR